MHRRSPLALDAALVLLLAVGLGAPSSALAHDVSTPAGHEAEDTVVHDAATEARLNRTTRLHSATAASLAAAAVAADPGQTGAWGPVVDWPVVGIHVALLPNGKVLAWDSVGDAATETFPVHNFTRATVYDPQTGSQTQVNVDTGYNIFCAGFAHLSDGSLFIAGGNKDAQLNGIVQTHLFNPSNNDWSLGPNMASGRWYPSVTPLTNGEMLITSGRVAIPEVRKTDGTLRSLSSASLSLPLYPWMDVAPDGRVFYSGPDSTLRKLDPAGTGSWQTVGQRDAINRDYGSHAVFDIGKTLVAGGGSSSNDARVIDTNGATPQVTATAPMAFGRRQHNLTLLADGSVLATGGNSTGAGLIDMNGGVYNAERWDPATGQWTTLAAQAVTRQYHSTALLLPDGRVLSSGGGICGTCDQVGYLAKNAEIFTPPYLFKKDGSGELAPRPEITDAPGDDRLRRVVPDHDAERRLDPEGGDHAAGVSDALGGDGAALRPARLHGRDRHADGDRPSQPERRGAGRVHALHRRLGRRAIGGEGARARSSCAAASAASAASPTTAAAEPAADRVYDVARERGELHLTRKDLARGDRLRPRRQSGEGAVLQRRDAARRGHDRSLLDAVEHRSGGHLHADGARDRQLRRGDYQQSGNDHGEKEAVMLDG